MDLVTAGSPTEHAEVPETDEADKADGVDGSSPLTELVREPQQERSRETLRRIVESSYTLLESGGTEALTVGAIAERARTSVGSFYARFDGKDELSRYLGELALGEVTAAWREGLSALIPEEGGDVELQSTEPRGMEFRKGLWEEVPPLLVDLYSEPAARRLALLDGVEDPPPRRQERLESLLLQDLLGLLEYPARPALHALVVARTTLAAARSLARRPTAGSSDAANGPHGSATGEAVGRNAEEEEVDEVARELGRLLDAYLHGAALTPEPRTESDAASPARTREPVAAGTLDDDALDTGGLDTGYLEPAATAGPAPAGPAPSDPDPDAIPEPEDEDDHLADPFDVWA